jgi:hypothetical protein
MRIFQTTQSTIRSSSVVLVLKNLQTKGGNLGELSEMVEALKQNTEQVRKLNELLAPELKRSEILRDSRKRQEILRDCISSDLARIRADDAKRCPPLSAESGDQYRS